MMTLRDLQKRINEVVAENNARWPERNELPVLIEVSRRCGRGHKSRFFPAEFLMGSMYTVAQQHFGCSITTKEEIEIKR
jgi:hypothetical protein